MQIDRKTHLVILIAWIITLLAIVVAATLAGCGTHPSNGAVVDRRFVPAHYDDYTTFICVAYNKYGGCMVNVPEFHHDYIENAWSLRLRNSVHTGWIEVTEDIYRRCGSGSHYPVCVTEQR